MFSIFQNRLANRAMRYAAWGSAFIGATVVSAADLNIDAAFTPADPTRGNYMDRAGVWNGTTEVTNTTGDTFSIQVENTAAEAFDLTIEVALPAGFTYVAGSAAAIATGVATPTVSANQVGTTLTFTLGGGEFDLDDGQVLDLDFGLVADASVNQGTHQLVYSYVYGDNENDNTPTTDTSAQNVIVQAGESVLSLSPISQVVGFQDVASWSVAVTNTGFGGLFDVEIDQSDLFGNASFSSVSTTQTSPAQAASNAGNVYTVPYLGPGETFTFTTDGTVADCSNLGNVAETNDRTGLTDALVAAAVVLDLDLPLVSFSGPNIALDYIAPTSISVPVSNLGGAGAAIDFILATNLNDLPVTISNVGGGFAYNSSSGEFSLTSGANGSDIADTTTETLTFDVVPLDACSESGGLVTWLALYENECGAAYQTPFDTSNAITPSGVPSVNLTNSNAGGSRLTTNESSSFDVALTATETARIEGSNLVVDITVGSLTVASIDGVNPTHGSVVDNGGGSYTWTVSQSDAENNNPVFVVDYTIGPDPCLGGDEFSIVASTSADSVLTSSGDICPLTSTDTEQVFVTNNPGTSSNQFYQVVGGGFEAGSPSTTNGTRENGEGEFIPIRADYNFAPGYPGVWTGSVYVDDLGGLAGQTLVDGSLSVSYASGSAALTGPVAVPSGSFVRNANGLVIDLDFLEGAGFFGVDSVSDTRIRFNYETTIPDAELTVSTLAVQQRSTLTLADAAGGSGACSTGGELVFRQIDLFNVQRAEASLTVDMPASLDICEVFDVVLTLGNENSQQISRPIITLDTSDPEYGFIVPQTPVYGGAFNSGNIVFSANGGTNPTFEYTGGDLPGNGTVTVQMIRNSVGGLAALPINASVDYDDNETNPTPATDFNATASDAPTFVLTGSLTALVTPDSAIQMNNGQIQWSVIVQNVASGTAFGSELLNQIPEFLSLDQTATDAANTVTSVVSGSPLSGGQLVTFDLGDMVSGEAITVNVIADLVAGSNCSIPDGQNIVSVQWGCGVDKAQVAVEDGPNVRFGSPSLQILHDTSNSLARLCGNGEVLIRVKNTGDSEISEIDVFEFMPESTTGLSIVPGTSEFATDNNPASFTSIADPSGTGTNANPYTFEIGAGRQINLSSLVNESADTGATVNEVFIRFNIEATNPNVFAGSGGPSLNATGESLLFCGASFTSPGVPFVIPTELPDISTELLVANNSLAISAAETVPGSSSDVVEWTFELTNNGNAVAENVRVRIPLTGSGGSATISGGGASGAYAGGWVALNDINPGATVTVTITETLGGTCVNTTSTAEVTWGCLPPASGSPSDVNQPTANADTASVFMNPDFDVEGIFNYGFSRLENSRGRVRLDMANAGARGTNLSIVVALPTNVAFDSSLAPVLIFNNSSLTAVSVDDTDPNAPILTFTGDVNFGEDFAVRFFVYSEVEDITRALSFPELTEEEETGNGLDPSINLGGGSSVTADYQNSCGDALMQTVSRNVDLRQPDLDINLAANDGSGSDALINRIVFPGVEETFSVWVRNEGEAASVASGAEVTVTLGAGWTGASVTLDGVAFTSVGAGVYTASPSDLSLDDEVEVEIRATPSGVVSDPLTVEVDVDLDQVLRDGSTVGSELTNDSRAFRVLAVEVDKEFVSTSETFTTGRDLAIGEEVTYDLSVTFYGSTADANALTNLVIRDSLGDLALADRGLALVSATVTSTELVPIISTDPAGLTTADPLQSGTIDFTLAAPGMIGPTNDEFTAQVVARVLNDTNVDAVNSDEKSIVNNLGVSFDFFGETYHSDDANDGFSGGNEFPELHDSEAATVQRPSLEIDKQVRNVTDGGSFDQSADGEATDVFEYRVVITNTDNTTTTMPLFDVAWTDAINAKLDLLDGSGNPAFTPGVDTTGNGVADLFFVAGVTAGPGGQLVANATNLPIGNAGEDFIQLDAGESITIHYFAQALQSVNPNEALEDAITATADTLPGASGSQTGTTGATGDDDGALELTATDPTVATINIFAVEQSKEIVTTSVGADSLTTVVVGEQVEFEVDIILPLGTAPDFRVFDTLSEEFELIEIEPVTIGSSITPTNSPPTVTPLVTALPANGDPLDLSWDFGNTSVVAGTDEERTIILRYTVQIRNLDLVSLEKDGTFSNEASYEFVGGPTDITDVTLTTAAAELVATKVASPDAGLDAGDEITYTVTIDNATGTAAAYDLNIVDTLPAGLSYKPASTVVLTGAGETSGLVGTLGEPDVNTGVLTWGRTQTVPVDLDLAVSGKLVFTYIVTVDDTVEPDQELTNDLVAGWTSLDGDPGPNLGVAVGTAGDANGERIDTNTAPNTNLAQAEDVVTIAKTTVQTKVASGDTLPLDDQDDGFRVGDLVTYTVEIDVMEGTHEAFQLLDTLPTGMAFDSFDAITPASGADGFTFTALIGGTTAPAAGATGNLVFDLGTLVNSGDAATDNDTLTLVYRARIQDVAAITEPDGDGGTNDSELTLTNSVTVSFLEADDEVFTTTPVTVDIDVKQPELAIDKERLLPASTNRVLEGSQARFRLTITNSGDAPAYNVGVLDTLPSGMRTEAPQLVAATLDGSDIVGALTPSFNSTNGEWAINLSNTQILDVGQLLVIDYDATVDEGLPSGQSLVNSADVNEYFSKPDNDTDERRRFDNVDPDTEEIISAVGISGTVFSDGNTNRTLNSGEDWSTGVTVYVNLVQGGAVVDSFEVSPGSGAYVFTDVAAGNYTVIVTDGPTNTTPVEPPQWIFFDAPPTDGSLNVTVVNSSVNDQDFPLIQGSFLDGVVFQDDGIGGGIANDGIQNGSESGLGQVTVRLTDGGATVYDSVTTNGAGEFTLFVPVGVADGATLTVEQFNLSSYTSTGGDAGTTGGAYDRSLDTIVFTHSTGVSQTGLVFGDVPANRFITDGQKVIEPGAVAFYTHTFIAGTGGEVVFDISSVESPALPGWGQTLFRDTNCNGQLDAGEPILTQPSGPITVAAQEEICIIVKDASPANTPLGAQNLNTVTATFTYTNSAPALATEVLTRTDTTIIGDPTTSGLELTKAVDKTTASPGEVITYTLTFTNNGLGSLNDIVIYDSTPVFTTFTAAPMPPSFPNALTAVAIMAPDPGNSGGITWTFTGTLEPGEIGEVTYQVTLDSSP